MFLSTRLTRLRDTPPPNSGQEVPPFFSSADCPPDGLASRPCKASTPTTPANTAPVAATDSHRRNTREDFMAVTSLVPRDLHVGVIDLGPRDLLALDADGLAVQG